MTSTRTTGPSRSSTTPTRTTGWTRRSRRRYYGRQTLKAKPDKINYSENYWRDRNKCINKSKEQSTAYYGNYTKFKYSKAPRTHQQELMGEPHYLQRMHYDHRSKIWYDGCYVENHLSPTQIADYISLSEEPYQLLEYSSLYD